MFNLKHKQRGVAAVEMSLVLPVMLLLFFATAEFGRALYQYNALTKMTRDATRYIIANPEFDSTNVVSVSEQTENAAKSLLVYGELSGTTELLPNLAATSVAVSTSGQFITVTVSYPWQPIWGDSLPAFVNDTIFDLNFPLVATYTMRAL
jgi:Flp pilus assembly protein TadG